MPEFAFNLSIDLLNLFRNPKINNMSFDPGYLKEMYKIVHALSVEYHIKSADRLYVLYLHLIFSLVENLKDFKELGEGRAKI